RVQLTGPFPGVFEFCHDRVRIGLKAWELAPDVPELGLDRVDLSGVGAPAIAQSPKLVSIIYQQRPEPAYAVGFIPYQVWRHEGRRICKCRRCRFALSQSRRRSDLGESRRPDSEKRDNGTKQRCDQHGNKSSRFEQLFHLKSPFIFPLTINAARADMTAARAI